MFLAIDFNNLFARAYYAFWTEESEYFAIYGLANIFLTLIDRFNPSEMHVAVDSSNSFRKALYPEYKATRKPKPEDWGKQFCMAKEWLIDAGLHTYEVNGFEGDDLIASLCESTKADVHILSSDKDTLQLINEHVFQIRPKGSMKDYEIWDAETVIRELGVPPYKVRDYLALVGDTSDNLPGAKGIGPAHAKKLLNQYSGIDEIYQLLEYHTPTRIRNILHTYKEDVMMCWNLVALQTPPIIVAYGSFDEKQIHRATEKVAGLEKNAEH